MCTIDLTIELTPNNRAPYGQRQQDEAPFALFLVIEIVIDAELKDPEGSPFLFGVGATQKRPRVAGVGDV